MNNIAKRSLGRLAGCGALALALGLASSAPASYMVSTFSSTSQLDLTGNFVAAENTAEPAASPLLVGGVTFTASTHFNTGNYVNTSPGLADPNLNAIMIGSTNRRGRLARRRHVDGNDTLGLLAALVLPRRLEPW